MAENAEFERGLDAEPENWNLRLVYADWLDEHGDQELAFAQRWMAKYQKRPSDNQIMRRPGEPMNYYPNSWMWWESGNVDPMSVIDRKLLDKAAPNNQPAYWTSRQRAERALAELGVTVG